MAKGNVPPGNRPRSPFGPVIVPGAAAGPQRATVIMSPEEKKELEIRQVLRTAYELFKCVVQYDPLTVLDYENSKAGRLYDSKNIDIVFDKCVEVAERYLAYSQEYAENEQRDS